MSDNTNRGWQSGKSQNECHRYMLKHHVACDVTINFPASGASGSTDKQLLAHKYMLVCRSPVFEAMLTGEFQEGQLTVTIPDVEPDVFMEVLKFMYYDGDVLTGHNVLHILYAAKKYLIDGLVEKCKDFLDNEMSPDNVCSILTNAIDLDERELADACMKFIIEITDKVLLSEDFVDLSLEGLYKLVSSEMLSHVDEVDVFEACMKWGRQKQKEDPDKKLRDILGKCLYEIRFTNLSSKQFSDIMEAYPCILSFEEQCIIFYVLAERDETRLVAALSKGFNVNLRKSLTYITPNRYQTVAGNPIIWSERSSHKIGFTTDKEVAFYGITMFGGFTEGHTRNVTLNLQDACGKCLLTTSREITYSGTKDPTPVGSTEAVRIRPEVNYIIEIIMNHAGGCDTFYGESGVESVTSEGVRFTFHGLSRTQIWDRGQIPQIMFGTIS